MHKSQGIEKTKRLAEEYCRIAAGAIAFFPESEAKTGLLDVLELVVKRTK